MLEASLNFARIAAACAVHRRRLSRLAGGHGLDDVLPALA